MSKILLIVIIVVLLAVGSWYFFSDKPLVRVNVFSPELETSQSGGSSATFQLEASPVSGTEITVQNCKADPYILQAQEGAEITFSNKDDVSHTLFIAGPDQEIELAAGASYKLVAEFPQGANFTYNYLCDEQGYPSHGGAIFITP